MISKTESGRVSKEIPGSESGSGTRWALIIITRPKAKGLAESWGQNTDQVGTLSGVLNVSLRASGAQLGYEKRER